MARDLRIGIDCGGDHASQFGGNKRLCAGRRTAGVVAGFERDVRRAPVKTLAGVLLCFAQSYNFGVVDEIVLVPTFADNLSRAVEDDAADSRIRRRNTDTAPGQFERALHPIAIRFELIGHGEHPSL